MQESSIKMCIIICIVKGKIIYSTPFCVLVCSTIDRAFFFNRLLAYKYITFLSVHIYIYIY